MGLLEEVGEPLLEAGSLAAEVVEVAGESTPLIGTGINAAKGIYHGTEAHDAEMAGDKDKASFYGNEAAYDWVKAIPGVGTFLGATELIGGAKSALDGGKFVDGMHHSQDVIEDLGAMAGIEEFGASRYQGDPNAHDTWGSHAALRDHVEDQERFEDAAERAKQQGGE
jgi:hypothetical protein